MKDKVISSLLVITVFISGCSTQIRTESHSSPNESSANYESTSIDGQDDLWRALRVGMLVLFFGVVAKK